MLFSFPNIDPVAFHIGTFPVRWYGVAYIVAFLIGWWHVKRQTTLDKIISPHLIDDLMSWLILGVIIGGRLGYVLFYDPMKFIAAPWRILFTWEGGMAFHGGVMGAATGIILFARRHQLNFWRLGDYVSAAAPIGLAIGRCANFINAELYGRITDSPWGIVFPGAGPWPRHPSQLYEALSEGPLLYLLLWWLRRSGYTPAPGQQVGAFFIGYGLIRCLVECVREPNHTIGYLYGGTTMGQWLSVMLIIMGIGIWNYARRCCNASK